MTKATRLRLRTLAKARRDLRVWDRLIEETVARQGDLHDDDWEKLSHLRHVFCWRWEDLLPADRALLDRIASGTTEQLRLDL